MRLLFVPIVFAFHFDSLSQRAPDFKLLRYEEDYSFLQHDTTSNWYWNMKYINISNNGNAYLSYGGDIRYQYFYFRNEGWGDDLKDPNGYLLTRWLAHVDINIGPHFRTFVQTQSSFANSRPSASPVDDNPLEIHQAFLDFTTKIVNKNKLIFRLGRQELSYGSQRLVSVREGPNNRQSFDAFRAIMQLPNSRFDLFYSHYVVARPGMFDDASGRDHRFWSAYLVLTKIPLIQNIDFYYLGLWKRKAIFDDGDGKEIRHSFGTRIWKTTDSWQYDIEALYQVGKFAGKNIFAWTTSFSTSYKFFNIRFKPQVSLKTELISGDKEYNDNRLQTFNPMFPRGAYFGLAALIGPSNLFDIHPSLLLNFFPKISFEIDYDVFWRHRRNDGLYAANTSLIYSGKNVNGKYIGSQLSGKLEYILNEFLYFRGEFTWFNAGKYLKEAGTGNDILFTGATVQFKF